MNAYGKKNFKNLSNERQTNSHLKLCVMKPEKILKSDVIDIVFENRNKLYGAYELRKFYKQRLQKSIAITALISLLIVLALSWKVPHKKGSFILENTDGAKLTTYIIPPETKVVEKKQTVYKKQIKQKATIKNVTTVVVPDKLVKEAPPAIEEMANKVIDTKTIAGENVGFNEVVAAPNASANASGNSDEVKTHEVEKPFIHAEIMPEFPGGKEAYLKFMQKNLKQPDDITDDEKFVVIASFIVSNDGSITNITIEKKGRDDLDKEVLRVINKMPKWLPGKQNGKFVSVYFKVPVTFIGQ